MVTIQNESGEKVILVPDAVLAIVRTLAILRSAYYDYSIGVAYAALHEESKPSLGGAPVVLNVESKLSDPQREVGNPLLVAVRVP